MEPTPYQFTQPTQGQNKAPKQAQKSVSTSVLGDLRHASKLPSTKPTFTEVIRWCQYVRSRQMPPGPDQHEVDAYMLKHIEAHMVDQRQAWWEAYREERKKLNLWGWIKEWWQTNKID